MNRRILWWYGLLFAAAAVLHLIAIIANGRTLAFGTQALLMPALALVLISPHEDAEGNGWWPRTRLLALGALGFSFLGDVLPRFMPPSWSLPTLAGLFLIAQIFWILALLPRVKHSILVVQRWRMVLYAVLAIVVLVACVPRAGFMAPLVIIYALALFGTATLATGWGTYGTVGGILFLISDSLIALFTFRPELDPGTPWRGLLIMSTYIVAQLFLVLAVRQYSAKDRQPVRGIAGTAPKI